MDVIFDFCRTFWNVFAMMAPWLIIGFLIAGIIAVCLPRDFVMRFLGDSGGIKSIIRAVSIGVPLPICSCGVIPISTALRKNGASKSLRREDPILSNYERIVLPGASFLLLTITLP